MQFTFSNNPIARLSCWFNNSIREPFSRWRDKHKKTHYECCVCGHLIAPYFDDRYTYSSVKHDYGWHKLKGENRWICHKCADHGFWPSSDSDIPLESCQRGYTWDEWQDVVAKERVCIRELIKTKDPEYYNDNYFYDDEESVERATQRWADLYGFEDEDEDEYSD